MFSRVFSGLSRITTAGRTFIPQIEGLRFLAILGVIAYHVQLIGYFFLPELSHAGDMVSALFQAGHFGVNLFFVISGFILSLPFAKQQLAGNGKPIRLRDYFFRRVTRIEPPYLIHLFVLFLLCAFVLRRMPSQPHLYQNPQWAKYASAHIFASLFYANGFIFGTHPFPNAVLWSLEVEAQFYIAAPFLAKVFRISDPVKRRFVIIGGIVATTITSGLTSGAYWSWASLVGNIPFFLIGLLLTDFYLSEKIDWTVRTFRWDCLSFAALAGVVVTQNYDWSKYLVPGLILLGCLGGLRGRLSSWFLSKRLIVIAGGMCYTVYLYHYLLISLFYRGTKVFRTGKPWLDLLIQFLIMLPLIFLVCAAMFAACERPFMRPDWLPRFWSRVSGRKPPGHLSELGRPQESMREGARL